MVNELALSEVKVDGDRFRRSFKEVEALAQSISKYGLMHPIVVDENGGLVAGERRYRAHKLLGLESIKVTVFDNLSLVDKKLLEIEENLRREDLTWQEDVMAMTRLHLLKVEELGKRQSRNKFNEGWGVQDTADLVGRSIGKVSQDLKLGKEMLKKMGWSIEGEIGQDQEGESKRGKVGETLFDKAKAQTGVIDFGEIKTKDAAIKVLGRNEDAATRKLSVLIDALAKPKGGKEEDGEPSESGDVRLVHGDCLEGLRGVESESVDCVITDPPWGVEFDQSGQLSSVRGGGTVVDEEKDVEFLRPVVKELWRVLKENSHMYFFFGAKHYERLVEILILSGFKVSQVPLVWWKRNAFNACAYQVFSADYEQFLFCRKGDRSLSKTRGSVFDFAPVAGSAKIHTAEKPVALIEELIELSTLEGEMVCEPFAGSGATLRAAKGLGRKGIGWEIDEANYLKAKERL